MRKMVTVVLLLVMLTIGGVIYNIRQSQHQVHAHRAVLLLIGSAQDKSWNEAHVRGLTMAAGKLGVEVVVRENVPVDERCLQVMEEAIKDGASYIFCTSVGFDPWTKQMADRYPRLRFFQCTGEQKGRNLVIYFGRMYQMRYLSGIVAGLESRTGRIGYVASFPLTEVIRGINAFTLGVKRANPDARVFVRYSHAWSDDEKNGAVTQGLLDQYGVDILSQHTDSQKPLLLAEERGVRSIGYNQANPELFPHTYLTAAVFRWELAYERFLRAAMQDVFCQGTYWDGMETGLVELGEMSSRVSAPTLRKLAQEREILQQTMQDVFNGPIYDREGNLRVPPNETISDYYLLKKMDWYVEGVVTDE